MHDRKVKLTCLNCGESDILTINELNSPPMVTWWGKILNTPFLSARFRGDQKWGFLCKCGNDNRLAKEEEKDFDNLVAGDPLTLQKIADSLKIPDEKQFKMENA